MKIENNPTLKGEYSTSSSYRVKRAEMLYITYSLEFITGFYNASVLCTDCNKNGCKGVYEVPSNTTALSICTFLITEHVSGCLAIIMLLT
jgi:hypothetical protein